MRNILFRSISIRLPLQLLIKCPLLLLLCLRSLILQVFAQLLYSYSYKISDNAWIRLISLQPLHVLLLLLLRPRLPLRLPTPTTTTTTTTTPTSASVLDLHDDRVVSSSIRVSLGRHGRQGRQNPLRLSHARATLRLRTTMLSTSRLMFFLLIFQYFFIKFSIKIY